MEIEIEHQRRLNQYYTNSKIIDIIFNDFLVNLQKSGTDFQTKNKKIKDVLDYYNFFETNQKMFLKKNKNLY